MGTIQVPSRLALSKQRSNSRKDSYGIDESYQESDQRHWTNRCESCGPWTALDKEFPVKLGQEVRIILPRGDGTYHHACPNCEAELDVARGEWVADYPGRPIHGYRISQLFSSKVDPGEIYREYRKTYNPERFYTLKIGIPWADVENKLSTHQVLALCGDQGLLERSDRACTMGVDTGKELHVVVSRRRDADGGDVKREPIWIGAVQAYDEIDS